MERAWYRYRWSTQRSFRLSKSWFSNANAAANTDSYLRQHLIEQWIALTWNFFSERMLLNVLMLDPWTIRIDGSYSIWAIRTVDGRRTMNVSPARICPGLWTDALDHWEPWQFTLLLRRRLSVPGLCQVVSESANGVLRSLVLLLSVKLPIPILSLTCPMATRLQSKSKTSTSTP